MFRKGAFVVSIVAMVLLALPALAQERSRSRTVRVDCSRRGASIARALETRADELVVEISGICNENLEIRRSNVTFRGASGDRTRDGIRGVGTDPAVAIVDVWDAVDVTFEDLTLAGGAGIALNAARSPRVFLSNCRLVDNGSMGVYVTLGSSVYAERCDFSRNLSGARATRASRFVCEGCSFEDNTGWAVMALEYGRVQIDGWWADPSLEGSEPPDVPSSVIGPLGVGGMTNGIAYLRYTTIGPAAGSDTGTALLASYGSWIDVVFCGLEGRVLIDNARVRLHEVTQASLGPAANSLRAGGQLQVSATSLVGPLDVLEFSHALIQFGSVVDGDVHCARAGDVWGDADSSVTGTVSDCPSWGGP